MRLQIDINDLDKYKSRDKIPCLCEKCDEKFFVFKNLIQRTIKGTKNIRFCSSKCAREARKNKVSFLCDECKIAIKVLPNRMTLLKHHFCSKGCAGKYNAKHKKYGCRRSKLEKWIEEELKQIYSTLLIEYNNRKIINGELDIYIPSLKLAFELNGIFHYEPIFGKEQLQKIQNRDKCKIQQCIDKKINLCIIDSSKVRSPNTNGARKIFDIIVRIIEQKITNDGAVDKNCTCI